MGCSPSFRNSYGFFVDCGGQDDLIEQFDGFELQPSNRSHQLPHCQANPASDSSHINKRVHQLVADARHLQTLLLLLPRDRFLQHPHQIALLSLPLVLVQHLMELSLLGVSPAPQQIDEQDKADRFLFARE